MTTPPVAGPPQPGRAPLRPDLMRPPGPMPTADAPARKGPPTGTGPAAKAAKPHKPRSWRWLRLVVPPVATLLVVLAGVLVYQLEQPDLEDGDYLSPTSRADIGGAVLADRVRAAGVGIERVTKTSDALVAAHAGNATLLVTTPQLVQMLYLRMLKLLPSTTKVVLVEPDRETIIDGLLPLDGTDRALVSSVTGPGCTFEPAVKAGRAGVRRSRYGPVDGGREVARCYDDSLVVFTRGTAEITAVGSADPFRNDRIGEHNNATLVTGLLTRAPKLIWLDLHRREPPPLVDNDPGLAGGPAAPPSLRPRTSDEPFDPDFPVKGDNGGDAGGQQGGGGDFNDGGGGGDPPNPLWQAFPPWVYVATALLALLFVMLALAQGRRLGSPVIEPLPVAVRASETVAGRGRLYQRAKAREESLRTLREAALARLIRLLRLESDVDRRTMIDIVAAQSGWPPALVDMVLFGPAPQDDAELVHAAVRLEQLVDAVATEKPVAAADAPAAAPEGDPR